MSNLPTGTQNPNRKFDFDQLLAARPSDPGVLSATDVAYFTDMTVAFATAQGGLYVFKPGDPMTLHPNMPAVIRANMMLATLAQRAGDASGGIKKPLVVMTEDVHFEGDPSWSATYADSKAMMFQVITAEMADQMKPSDIATKVFTLEDLKRHVNTEVDPRIPLLGGQRVVMRVYTPEHGRAGTPDAQVIPQLRNHPVTKMILPKGHTVSRRTQFKAEQFAVGMLDTGESTGYIELWHSQGYNRFFIVGLCGNICNAWMALALTILSSGKIEVFFLVDAQIPLPVPASPFDTTEQELNLLGLDARNWLGLNPACPEPLSLEQLWGARFVYLGVKFSTVEQLRQNMTYLFK